jgi:hypothetical protein
MTVPRAPKGLGIEGRRLWRGVLADLDFEDHELAVLRRACHVADRCTALQEVVDCEGMFAENRLGEQKMHPALIELRQQELLLAKLVAVLRIPPAEDEQHRPQLRTLRGINTGGAG